MAEETESETLGTILIAQREPQDQAFAQTLLGTFGKFDVVGATSSAEVIRRLTSQPNLILADPLIPGDFLRAVELIRRMPKLNHVAIVALSGDLSQAARCSGKGFNAFIHKPFRPESLLAKIWKILDSQPQPPSGGNPAELNVDVDQIEGLPTLPTVYAQVEELCADPNVDAGELAKVIETDPSITMKLLKLSNSAFFGFTREIKSIGDAVSLLGNETVKNAVLSISVFEATKDMEDSAGIDRMAFWQHATAVGSIVRFIAKKMNIQREECFTAGILHDIGKIVLDGLFSEFYSGVLKAVNEQSLSILEAEERVIGLTHTKLGHELAESWGIPSVLAQAILYHHRPKSSDSDAELASLVHIADASARNQAFGSGGDPYVPAIHPSAFEHLEVSGNELIEWESEMKQVVEKDMAFLSAIG